MRRKLEDELWKGTMLQRTAALRGKVEDAKRQNATLSKGTGGNVSAVRKTLARIEILAEAVRVASTPAGVPLIHGSVALTWFVENTKDALEVLKRNAKQLQGYNIQNHPFVDLGKNCTVDAYTLWHDMRLGMAAERYVRRAYGLSEEDGEDLEEGEFAEQGAETSLSSATAESSTASRKRPSDKELRNEVLVVKRALMRKDVLSTLVFDFEKGSKYELYFGSTRVCFCVMTYRAMPSDIENQIRSSGMTTERVMNVVMSGRRKYETYFMSAESFAKVPRRARSVPSKQMKSYFDKAQFSERNILRSVVEETAAENAVRRVFAVEKNGDENLCQRAFAHWFMDEMKSIFGARFVEQYKASVSTAMSTCRSELLALFGEMHADLLEIMKDYRHTLFETLKSKTRSSRPSVMRGGKRAANASDDAASCSASQSTPLGDALHSALQMPVGSIFKKTEKHTKLHVMAAERKRKRRAAQGLSTGGLCVLPRASPSAWKQQFPSEIATLTPCPAQVQHSMELIAPALSELSKCCLRRTETEVLVGESIVQTATNATDARVAARTRASQQPHDVGGASRRMLSAHATKPIPRKDYIHHTQSNGLLKQQNERRELMQRFEEPLTLNRVLDMSVLRRRAQLLVAEFEPEDVPLTEGDLLVCDPLQEAYALNNGLAVEAAHRVCAALLKSRTPPRTASETNNALMKSKVVSDVVLNLARKCETLCARLWWQGGALKSHKKHVRELLHSVRAGRAKMRRRAFWAHLRNAKKK